MQLIYINSLYANGSARESAEPSLSLLIRRYGFFRATPGSSALCFSALGLQAHGVLACDIFRKGRHDAALFNAAKHRNVGGDRLMVSGAERLVINRHDALNLGVEVFERFADLATVGRVRLLDGG